jgi:hypothetical protein
MSCTCGGVLEYSEISDQMVCDACGSSPDSGDSDAGYDNDHPANNDNSTPGFVPSPELQYLIDCEEYDDYKHLLAEEKGAYESAMELKRLFEELSKNTDRIFDGDTIL